MKKIKLLSALSLLLLFVLLLSGCADAGSCVATDDAYGFWGGLWHGIIFIPDFIGSLFSDDIAIYAVNNNGGWYDFGYFIGVGGLASLLGLK